MGALTATKTPGERSAMTPWSRSRSQYGNCASLLHPSVTWVTWGLQSSVEMPAKTQCKVIHESLLMQINWHTSELIFWQDSSGPRSQHIHKFLPKYATYGCQNHAFYEQFRTSLVLEVYQPLSCFPSVMLPPQSLIGKLIPKSIGLFPLTVPVKQICLRWRKTVWPYFSNHPLFLQMRSFHKTNLRVCL